MSEYLQKYVGIMQELLEGKNSPQLQDFSDAEINKLKLDLSDFDSLVNYDIFMGFVSNKFAKDVIVKELFFDKMYVEKTAEYNWLIQKKQLSQLQDRDRYVENLKQANGSDIRKIYLKSADKVKIYNQLLPYQGEIINQLPVDELQDILNIDGAVRSGNNVYFLNAHTGDDFTCKIGEENLTVVAHDERKNPFKASNFRIFNSNGELLELDDGEYVKILRSIRKKISRNYETLRYQPDKPFGGRIVQLNSAQKVVLFSNNWQDELCNVDGASIGRDANFKTIIIPQMDESIRTDEQCDKIIKGIQFVEITSNQKHEKQYVQALVNKAVADYTALDNNPISLEDFLQMRLKKQLGDSTIYLTTPEQTKFLKARLIGNQNFYNMSKKEKENVIAQRKFIELLATKFYEDALSRNAMSYAGQLLPLKVNLAQCVKLLKADLKYIEKSGANVDKQNICGPYNIEKQIGLAAFVAYKNLIHNQFISDMFLSVEKKKKHSEKHNQQVSENLRCLQDVDMSMVETYNNRIGQKKVETISEKRGVLAVIRHSIMRNEFKVQFGSDFSAQSCKLAFCDMEGRPYTVSINDFIRLVQNPLFVNYKPESANIIEAQNEEELLQFIQNLCKNMSKDSKLELGE